MLAPESLNFSPGKTNTCGSGRLQGRDILLKLIPACSEFFWWSWFIYISPTAAILSKVPSDPFSPPPREATAPRSPPETQNSQWILDRIAGGSAWDQRLRAQDLGHVLSSTQLKQALQSQDICSKLAPETPPCHQIQRAAQIHFPLILQREKQTSTQMPKH